MSTYFHEETDKKILDYQIAHCQQEKDAIFEGHIKEPFELVVRTATKKTSLNWIFLSGRVTAEEVAYHMRSKIDNYKHENGRAFSYFSSIAKNYLLSKKKDKGDETSDLDKLNNFLIQVATNKSGIRRKLVTIKKYMDALEFEHLKAENTPVG